MRRLRTSAFFAAIMAGSLNPASAHIVTEEPWHPAAAGYRTMLFIADLKPVVWELVGEAYERKHPAAVTERPAKASFDALPDGAGAAIGKAIAAKDRQALYESATRGMSRLVRQTLGDAAAALATPGRAHARVLEAQALYRAFGDFVTQADPAEGKRIGLAWLELTSSAGSSGVLGAGGAAPDQETFSAARKTIEDYLVANFEPQRFAPRKTMAPIPESAAARADLKITPWLPPGSNINDQDPLPKLVLNFEERKIEEKDLPLVAYGDMLFDSPLIFGEPARSLGLACSTCHNRSDVNQNFFITGLSHQKGAIDVDGSYFNPLFNDYRRGSLDIPCLRGLRFTGPYGRDGRFGSLRDFMRNVIVERVRRSRAAPFVLDSLVAYMLEFDFLPNSKVDNQGRLTDQGPGRREARRDAVPQAVRRDGRQVLRELPRSRRRISSTAARTTSAPARTVMTAAATPPSTRRRCSARASPRPISTTARCRRSQASSTGSTSATSSS